MLAWNPQTEDYVTWDSGTWEEADDGFTFTSEKDGYTLTHENGGFTHTANGFYNSVFVFEGKIGA